MSSDAIVQNYFDDALSSFRAYKKLAEKAIAQLKDEEFFVALDEESNSVAVITIVWRLRKEVKSYPQITQITQNNLCNLCNLWMV